MTIVIDAFIKHDVEEPRQEDGFCLTQIELDDDALIQLASAIRMHSEIVKKVERKAISDSMAMVFAEKLMVELRDPKVGGSPVSVTDHIAKFIQNNFVIPIDARQQNDES